MLTAADCPRSQLPTEAEDPASRLKNRSARKAYGGNKGGSISGGPVVHRRLACDQPSNEQALWVRSNGFRAFSFECRPP